jgi:hypothetical protein
MDTRNTAMATTTLEEVIDHAERVGFSNAATLLRFAAKVLLADIEEKARWVVRRAIDTAEQELRNAVDEGDDVNVVESRLAALRLRLGISGIGDIFTAGSMADEAVGEHVIGAAEGRAAQILESAAKACYLIAFRDGCESA